VPSPSSDVVTSRPAACLTRGRLWRWDGFSVAANAPTGAARRLAGKNRFTDIEAELQAVRGDVEGKRAAAEAAEADVAAAAEAESAARTRWRGRQHEADDARDQHANAEREAGRNAARLSALGEARRGAASREEASSARGEAERAVELPPATVVETELAAVRSEIEGHRAARRSTRGAQAAREAELAARRLATIAADRDR
jgi:chromosome segregation protein